MFGFFDMFEDYFPCLERFYVFFLAIPGLCCCRVRGSSRSDQAAEADGEGPHGRGDPNFLEISEILILDQLVVWFSGDRSWIW